MSKRKDSHRFGTEGSSEGKNADFDREYLTELFNFAYVLRGEVKHLERIKEYIISEYVNKGLVKLIRPTYDKEEIFVVSGDEWKEYQELKRRKEDGLIGLWP